MLKLLEVGGSPENTKFCYFVNCYFAKDIYFWEILLIEDHSRLKLLQHFMQSKYSVDYYFRLTTQVLSFSYVEIMNVDN